MSNDESERIQLRLLTVLAIAILLLWTQFHFVDACHSKLAVPCLPPDRTPGWQILSCGLLAVVGILLIAFRVSGLRVRMTYS